MAVIACDNCGEPYRFMVGDSETGAQRALCAGCIGVPTGKTAPDVPPGECEMCQTEAPTMVLRQLATGDQFALCVGCSLVQGRMTWLTMPAELQEQVDERARALVPDVQDGGASRRGRKRGVAVGDEDRSPLRAVEAGPPAEEVAEYATLADAAGTPDPED